MNIPSTISTATSLVQAFFDAHPGVDVIRLICCDYANVVRGCLVTRDRLLALAADPEQDLALNMHTGTLIYYLPDGKITYDVWREASEDRSPDWKSIRLFSSEPRHAIMFCDVQEEEGVDEQSSKDPRVILRRIEQEAQEVGIEFKVGIEIEFTIMENIDSPQGLKTAGGHWSTSAFRHPTYPVLLDMRRQLEPTGVKIWSTEKELGHGQWEISTCPSPPTRAADDYVLAHETICTVAYKHGMHATMHSSPFVDASPLGLHFHISLNSPEVADHFLAGIMEHAPALTAFWLGGFDSFASREWMVGGQDITWGRSKMCSIKRAGPAHFELRIPDAHTNIHLQLAAVLGVGMKGIADKLELRVKEIPPSKPGEGISDEDREKLGIRHQIKRTLEERLQCLEDDQDVFGEILGKETVKDYLTLRRKEIQALEPMDPAIRRRIQIANI